MGDFFLKPESARALWLFAAVLALAASMIPSPSGGFILSATAALVALPPAFFGRGRARLSGVAVCSLSLILAATLYSAMQNDQAAYAERSKMKSRSDTPNVSASDTPGERSPPARTE